MGLTRVTMLGLPLDLVDLELTLQTLETWLADPRGSRTVITLNPELVVQSRQTKTLEASIQESDLVTADGVGIAWAAKHFGHALPGRATGVDIAQALMRRQGPGLRVFFLGAAPGTAERAAEHSRLEYGVVVAGVMDGKWGYGWNPDDPSTAAIAEQVAQQVRDSRADLLLTALGSTPNYPSKQEIFNHRYRPAKVSIGVGGTLNVLAGDVERAPAWTSKLGIEWVYRITTMRRWARALRLLEFVGLVLRAPK